MFASCAAVAVANDNPFQLVAAFPNLAIHDTATALAILPGKSPQAVAAYQHGEIRILPTDRDSRVAPLFLDLRQRMKSEKNFEDGLHGVAFHPDFATRRKVYVSYSQSSPRRTVLSEFTVPAGGTLRADPKSERMLLEYPHLFGNHWGGGIGFGPDGYLYLGIGDGGMRDDPYRLGQNLWSLHGKILRLDVNGRSPGLAYRIPKDNPFAGKQEIRGEIWAYGIRNPWGMSFDKATGTLWCGDVGQDTWEEVNVITAGGNYGWSEREGPERFAPRTGEEPAGMIDPIHAYRHSDGISVTGGFVYRGKRFPALQGSYLFGDWGMGKVWALPWNPTTKSAGAAQLLITTTPESPRFNPTVIAADAQGEPLMFTRSGIYTLARPQLLADAEESSEASEVSEMPGETGSDNHSS